MPDRKKIVHYCAMCNKRMNYLDKKMLYTYDIISERRKLWHGNGEYDRQRPKKRISLNLCESCLAKVEKMINGLIETNNKGGDDI